MMFQLHCLLSLYFVFMAARKTASSEYVTNNNDNNDNSNNTNSNSKPM